MNISYVQPSQGPVSPNKFLHVMQQRLVISLSSLTLGQETYFSQQSFTILHYLVMSKCTNP